MVTTGSLVSAATAVRVGVGWVDLVSKRGPALVNLAVAASMGTDNTPKAQAQFREGVIALARESAELSWRELRRAVDDLDSFTRPRHAPGTDPHRPYRVKL
jgi:hypothetical protein